MNRWDIAEKSLLRYRCILNGEDAGRRVCTLHHGEVVALALWDVGHTLPPAAHLPDFPEWWTLGP